jgi:hypothetical protein
VFTLCYTYRSHIKELVAVLFCIATSSETPVLPANLSDAAKVSIHVYVYICIPPCITYSIHTMYASVVN